MSSAKIFNRLHFLLASTLLLLLSCSGQGASLLFSFATSTPENLRATASGLDVAVNWEPVEEANSYTLYRYANAGCSYLPDSYAQCEEATRWSRINTTSIEDANLDNDTTYYYRVMAHGADSDSELSLEVSATIEPAVIPEPARNLTVTLEPGSVHLEWTGDSNTDNYVVFRVTEIQGSNCSIPDSFTSCGDTTEAIQSSQLEASETSWINDSITDGQTYFYVVVSYNEYGSRNSESIFVRTIPASPAISGTTSSNDGLLLQWDDLLGASYYELYRYSNSGCLTDTNIGTFANCDDALLQSNLTSSEYLDDFSGVASNIIYYRLRAGNSSGLSNLSEEYYYNLELSPPDEFNLTTNGSIHNLNWSEVLRANGYSLYRYSDSSCTNSPADCADVSVFNLAAGVLSYTDESAVPGVFYYYSLRANDGSGWSAYTQAESTSTAPLAVSNLQAAGGDQQVDLSWDSNANAGDTVYTIYRSECSPELLSCTTISAVGVVDISTRDDGATSFSDSEVDNAQKYYYFVSSSVDGWELNSSVASATTDAKALANLTVTLESEDSVSLAWDDPSDNQDEASYSVYVYPCLPTASGCILESTETLGTGDILTHSVDGLIPGSRYYFHVGVSANGVEHNTSTVDAYTEPLEPESLSYVSGVEEITISWQSNNGDDTTYEVESYFCDDGGACGWDQDIHLPSAELSFIYDNLTPGESYLIRVRARSGDHDAVSAETSVLTTPVAPEPELAQLELEAGHSAITIRWDASINGDNSFYTPVRYPCDLANGESCTARTLTSVSGGTGYTSQTDEGLASGNLYSYLVRVTNGALSVDSPVLSEITAPLPPNNVGAIGGEENVTVSWGERNSEIPNYDLYQSLLDCGEEDLLDGNISACGTINLSEKAVSGIVLSDLEPATRYYYNLKAYNPSNDLSTFTSSSEYAVTNPALPENVQAESQTSGITLSWDEGDNGSEATWRVYRYSCNPDDDDCSDDDYQLSFDYDTLSSIDAASNVVPASIYYYVVSAIANNVEVKAEPVEALSAPTELSDLTASSGVTDDSSAATNVDLAGLYVNLSWGDNGNDIDTNYTVHRKDCGEQQRCDTHQFASYTGAASYEVQNTHEEKDSGGFPVDLNPATLYTYIVNMSVSSSDASITVDGNSSVEVITRPVAVTDMQVVDGSIGSYSVDLQWQDNGGDGDDIDSYAGNGAEVSYQVDAYLCPSAAEDPATIDDDCEFINTYDESIDGTEHSVTGLNPGSYHSLLVRASAGGASIDSAPLNDVITKPEAVSDVTAIVSASADHETELTATWNSANGSATSYNRYLYECISRSTCSTLVDSSSNIAYSIDNSGLYTWADDYSAFNSSLVYEVVIAAETASGEVNATAIRFAPLPKAADDLSAEVIDANTIKLSWSNTGSHTGHEVYVFTEVCDEDDLAADIADLNFNFCGIVADGTTSNTSDNFTLPRNYNLEFADLIPGTLYHFAVKTINESGETWSSTQAEAITHPSPVIDLNGSATTATIAVSWSASDNGAETSYAVYIFERDCSADCSLLTDYPVGVDTATSYTATGLFSGSNYSIIVASVADEVEVNASAFDVITVPIVPEITSIDLNATAPSSSIDLGWDSTNINNGAVTSYRLLRFSCADDDCSTNDANLTVDLATFNSGLYIDSGLASGTGYQYILQAHTSVDEANSTTTEVIYTNSEPVSDDDIVISDITTDGFKVSFTAPKNNGPDTSYGIYLSSCSGDAAADCADYDFTALDSGETELAFEDLDSAQYYGAFVAALIDDYEVNSSITILATLPRDFTSFRSSVSDQSISLNYSSANGSAAEYRAYLYKYTSLDDKDSAITISNIGSTSHTISDLDAGTKYDVAVGVSVTNGSVTTEINSSIVSSTTHPFAVTELQAVSGDQSISLSWTNGNDENNLNGAATSYTVYRYDCDPDECVAFATTTAADSTKGHTSTGLAPGEDYYYIIGAQAGGVEATEAISDAETLPTELKNISTTGLADSLSVVISYESDNGSSSTYTAYRFDCGYTNTTCSTAETADATMFLDDTGGTDTMNLAAASYYRYVIGVSSGGQETNATATPDALTAPVAPSLDINNISSDQNLINVSSYTVPVGEISTYYLVLTENDCSEADIEADKESSCGEIDKSTDNDNDDIDFRGLNVNSQYFLRIYVENATGNDFSDSVAFYTLPDTPSLDIAGIDSGLEVLVNSANSEGTSYSFLLSDSECSAAENCDFNYTFNNISLGEAFTIGSTDVDPGYFIQGTTYYGAVQGTNAAGSYYSEVVSATTVPAAPTNIIATGGTKQIEFSWGVVQGASAYHARAYINSCDASYLLYDQEGTLLSGDVVTNCGTTYAANVIDAPLSTEVIVSNLSNGKSYYYRLGSSNEAGNANWSEEFSMDTLASAPSSLQASDITSSEVDISWYYNTNQVVNRQDLYRYTEECSAEQLLDLVDNDLGGAAGTVSGDSNCGDFSYTQGVASKHAVSDLNGSTTYYFRVAVVNAAGSSLSSEVLTVTTTASAASASVAVEINEPLQSEQWYLTNTGQKAYAGEAGIANVDINHSGALELGFTGANIRVNVIDTGMEMQHPDLLANIVADGSYDYVDDDNDPSNYSTTSGDHGTSVAGLIAADDNGAGITGVAPDALLQAFNYLRSSQTTADYLLAHGGDTKLDDTAIFNKSLGVAANYDYRISSTRLEALSCFTSGGATDHESPEDCSEALRSGLGAIYVKAAGNDFADADDELCLSFGLSCRDANMDAEHTYPYQVVVGALNASGTKSSYSNAGSAVWLTAPAGEYGWDYDFMDSELNKYGYTLPYDASSSTWHPAMLTTDQVGCDRGNTTYRYDFEISGVPPIGATQFHEDDILNPDCDYASTFNGTSAATPVASGVIALMLEANANLSWRDVKHILAASSDVIDASIAEVSIPVLLCSTDCSDGQYTSSDSLEFVARDSWQTNAAGYDFHNWYGFGAVNAGAAVAMAQAYASQLGQWQKLSVSQNFNQDIPDATGSALQVSINQPDDITVEAVQLDLQIDHSYLGNLSVVLVSPSGTRSVLLTPFGLYDDNVDFDANLLSNAFYGEAAAGDWQLEIYDLMQADTGSLVSATLNVYGH